MNLREKALEKHREWKGKIDIVSKSKVDTKEKLYIANTHRIAEHWKDISKNIGLAYEYTMKGNTIAIISDGTAVLGLGDIGPEAAMPVMEGKAVLFKEFGDVNAIPICLNTKDVDEIVNFVRLMEPGIGGVNLEDISAPRCFEIERRLEETLKIPVFHDDQHGTAVVTLAALINALRLTGKKMEDLKIIINGPGAAGTAICKLLIKMGAKDIIMCDSKGILVEGRDNMTSHKVELSKVTNKGKKTGGLADAIEGCDVFIGVSAANIVDEKMIKSMQKDPIIFAMANPVPEIDPELAKKYGAAIVGTGRSDYANQINNVLAFPGIFKGTLEVRASKINDEMKIAAAYAIADVIPEIELKSDYIIPEPFDMRVKDAVCLAVKKRAIETGVSNA